MQLNQQLTAIAKQQQINIDERPFKPHVTLIKKVHQPIRIDFEPVFWRSDGFCLVESRSTDTGVDYEILEHWPSTTPLAS
jgi:2'-5' RNA ligase